MAIPAVPSPSARSWPRGDLDVILTHKLRAPGQPELAIGSVSEEVAGKGRVLIFGFGSQHEQH